jgi:hypothetical protein
LGIQVWTLSSSCAQDARFRKRDLGRNAMNDFLPGRVTVVPIGKSMMVIEAGMLMDRHNHRESDKCGDGFLYDKTVPAPVLPVLA